jgi:hypothetical protein
MSEGRKAVLHAGAATMTHKVETGAATHPLLLCVTTALSRKGGLGVGWILSVRGEKGVIDQDMAEGWYRRLMVEGW